MSASKTKRPLAEARAQANELRALIGEDCFERCEIAGSVRRECVLVGDVEFVVIPKRSDVSGDGLFFENSLVNLLLFRLDQLLAFGLIAKHVYSGYCPEYPVLRLEPATPVCRWGDLYRGVDYKGNLYEFFSADELNWGAQLLIRTGSENFSRNVMGCLKYGSPYRQQGGYLRCVTDGKIVPVPDEETYLRYAGLRWVEPRDRT